MKYFRKIVDSPLFHYIVILLIIANTVILGLETDLGIMKQWGNELFVIQNIILHLFVLEIVLKIIGYRKKFFRNPWNIFDLVVVAIAFLPTYGVLSVFRSLGVLRVLMLVSDAPKLRRMADGILHAVPGVVGVLFILTLIIYMFAVASTKLYGGSFPEWFGRFDLAFVSLATVLTPLGWSGIVPEVNMVFPSAILFFGSFAVLSAVLVLSIIVSVIADAVHMIDKKERVQEITLLHQIQAELADIKARLKK